MIVNLTVSLEHITGKFVAKDELVAALIEDVLAIGVLYVDESEYELMAVEDFVPPKKGRK